MCLRVTSRGRRPKRARASNWLLPPRTDIVRGVATPLWEGVESRDVTTEEEVERVYV